MDVDLVSIYQSKAEGVLTFQETGISVLEASNYVTTVPFLRTVLRAEVPPSPYFFLTFHKVNDELSVNDLDASLDKDTPIPKRRVSLSSSMKQGRR